MNEPPIINVLASLTGLGALTFVLLFVREPWWRSWFGRSLMTMAVSILIFSGMALLSIRLGQDYPGRDALRLAGYLLLAGSMWSRVYVLWRVRHDEREHMPPHS